MENKEILLYTAKECFEYIFEKLYELKKEQEALIMKVEELEKKHENKSNN